MGYKLREIVSERLIEMGESNLNKYARAYQLAVACLRSLNMDLSGVPKIVSLSINSNDTVDLPNDYLQYTRVAICDKNGNLRSLGINNNFCLNQKTNDCGDPQSKDIKIGGMSYSPNMFFNNYRNGEVIGKFFGLGGGNNAVGSFRIDRDRNQILLGALGRDYSHIVLEYISDIDSVNDDYEVHPYIVEAVKDYITWKMYAFNPKMMLGDKQLFEKSYWNNYRLAKNRFAAFTTDEFLQAIRSGNFASPKF